MPCVKASAAVAAVKKCSCIVKKNRLNLNSQTSDFETRITFHLRHSAKVISFRNFQKNGKTKV